MRLWSNTRIGALLFVGVLLVYVASPVSQSADSFWTVPVMISILTHGDTNLDEYQNLMREKRYRGVECVTADYRVVARITIPVAPAEATTTIGIRSALPPWRFR